MHVQQVLPKSSQCVASSAKHFGAIALSQAKARPSNPLQGKDQTVFRTCVSRFARLWLWAVGLSYLGDLAPWVWVNEGQQVLLTAITHDKPAKDHTAVQQYGRYEEKCEEWTSRITTYLSGLPNDRGFCFGERACSKTIKAGNTLLGC